MPRPDREPRPGDRRLHGHHLLARLAPHQARVARRARPQRQPDARDNARRRRRLRAEGRDLSGISVRRGLRQAARASGEMDRGSPRELRHHPPGARPVLGPGIGTRRRCKDSRIARQADPRDRRVRAVGPGAALDRGHHGARPLCGAELPDGTHCRLHQQDFHHAGARRRPARRRVRDGAADGPRRAAAQARSGRSAAAQFHQARADALQGRHHLPRRQAGDLRQRRLSGMSGRRAQGRRL